MRVAPCPGARALLAGLDAAVGQLAGVHQLDVAVVLLGLLVHELEDALGTGCGHGDEAHLLRDLRDGLREVAVERDKAHERADGEAAYAADGRRRAYGRDDHVGEVPDVGVERHDEVGDEVCAGGRLEHAAVHATEVLAGTILVVEDLHDLLAVHRLLDVALEGTGRRLLLGVVAARERGEAHGHCRHNRHERDRERRERHREHAHGDEGDHERHERVHHLRQRLAVELAQRVHVVGVDGHDVAVRVRVKVADG